MTDFSETQIQRYARHIVLREIGGVGQRRLLNARVLVIGAGGLGAPALMYLAAAGVGCLGVIDHDRVDLSNLQRQIIHDSTGIDRLKVDSAADALSALNSDIRIERHSHRFDRERALDLVSRYDLVLDASDNFETRYLANDACFLAGKPLISAAAVGFDGQISLFKAHLGAPHPCYRCFLPEPPPASMAPTCATAGVIGALVGVMGSLQALEAIKELLGIGESLSGHLLLYSALDTRFQRIKLPRDPDCALCGLNPTIHDA
jgi:molybdopterin/thiamine biosynthesis adenylyltransferase